MRPEDILTLLRQKPFVPLRFHLTDGRTFEIHHPDQALVLRARIDIGVRADPATGPPDHAEYIALLHLVRIEELPPPSPAIAP